MTTPNPVAGPPGQGALPRAVLQATVEEYQPLLLSSATKRANGDPHLGADVLQQVYANILQRIADDKDIPSEPHDLKKYIHRAVRNEATDYYRSYGGRVFPQGLENPLQTDESDEGNPEEGVILEAAYGEIAIQVNTLLDKLPARQREVVRLMFWKQKSKEEVADELGIAVDSVARYLHAAKKNLKKEATKIRKEVVV
jgi:RNA polymerase sigma factor (sigma-70 family)